MTCQVSKQNFVLFGGVFKINYSAKQYTHQQQIDLALPDSFYLEWHGNSQNMSSNWWKKTKNYLSLSGNALLNMVSCWELQTETSHIGTILRSYHATLIISLNFRQIARMRVKSSEYCSVLAKSTVYVMGWPVWPYSHHYFYGNSYSFPRKKGEFHKKAHALFEMMTKKIRLIFSCEIGFFSGKIQLIFFPCKNPLLGEFSIHFRSKGDLNGTKSR